MWLIAFRDLQWRRRRFLIAIAATSLVFAMTLLLTGVSASLHQQDRRIVTAFGAESWLVDAGASGPFTASRLIPDAVAAGVATAPGVVRADPVVISRSTASRSTPKDVNLVGYRPGGLGTPRVGKGRPVERSGELVADSLLGFRVGDRVVVGGRPLTVVGVSSAVTFYFGTPTVMTDIEDAQVIAFAGQPFVSAVAVDGRLGAVPAGLRSLTVAEAQADLKRPTAKGDQTITFINALLWIVAVGIIGSIVYLSALERTRDFAVMKATGAGTGALLVGLALQALVLSLAAAVLAFVVAQVLAPGFPFSVAIPASAYVTLVMVAAVVGIVASGVGLRRAVRVDPALAFGGA